MSAFIVSKNHILFLITAALSRNICTYGFTWHHNKQHHELPPGDFKRAADVGNLLWQENIRSVSHRYPGESSATLPGTRGNDGFVITEADIAAVFDRADPVQVIKSCDCYEYQSCEHDGWPDSEACAIITKLRREACNSLPGYHAAEWGAPEPQRNVVRLSALSRSKPSTR